MEPLSQPKPLALANFLQTLNSSQLAYPTTTSRLRHTADVKNSKGQTHLHLAAKRRQTDLLRAHVGYTRDVNAADCRGNRPLHLLFSSSCNDEDEVLASLVRILLDNGADVEARNDEGKTPLHAAVACGSIEAVELLLNNGADAKSCDNRGFGVLHYLAGSPTNAPSCSDLLQLLLNIGCDVNSRSHHGRTPLYIAVYTGHNVCFDILIERGATVRYRDVKFDTTILHIAVKFAKDYVVDRLMRMLSRGDGCEKDGELNLSCLENIFKVVGLKLSLFVAMINARQKDGRTALHLATRHKLTSTLFLLLRNGADVESVDSYGRTPLHYACQYGNADAFDELMDFGADIGALDNKGLTPMKMNDEVEAVIWLRVVTRNAKSMAVGLPVVDFRKNLVQIMRKMKSYAKYNVEVEQMKRAMINSRVSVYDLLMDEDKMYKYRNNVVLKEIVMFGKLFPSFREMLIGKFRRAGMRRNLVRLASKALCKMTGFRSEDELSDMIFEKLNNAELHGVVEAAVNDDED